jgi:hypothetical protein
MAHDVIEGRYSFLEGKWADVKVSVYPPIFIM